MITLDCGVMTSPFVCPDKMYERVQHPLKYIQVGSLPPPRYHFKKIVQTVCLAKLPNYGFIGGNTRLKLCIYGRKM